MNREFYNKLITIVDEENVLINESMSKHTTFRIGGNADYYVSVQNVKSLREIVDLCKEKVVSYYIIGNGSNLLVADRGVRGIVIQIGNQMNCVTVEGTKVIAQAGTLLSKVAKVAQNHCLTGFEFAGGIPGTIGGAVRMNAGAYGGEMKDVLKAATVMDEKGNLQTLPIEELELGYRTSIVSKKQYIVVEVELELEVGDAEKIAARMDELKLQRTTKQPLEFPSGGSTFKRPEGYFAAKLIDDAGLRGFQVGGAQVSEKHCGFVINTGGATAQDVLDLTEQVADKVEALFGVRLEMEIRKIGEF